MQNLHLIDTHTGGEPTRAILSVDASSDGSPVVKGRSATERLAWLRGPGDWIRRATVLEPRGSEQMVGALLGPPVSPSNHGSVVFFNNQGYLGMCGHALIGVVETLRHRGLLDVGRHGFETPVGDVMATLHGDRSVSFENVASYRTQADVQIPVVDGWPWMTQGSIRGDVAYGGNWFFLVEVPEVAYEDIERLTRCCKAIGVELTRAGITGEDGQRIDHIELSDAKRNFVLCPGGHYDRSPCGTGTSAKVACLAADGKLAPGEVWTQESIIGSRFTASYQTLPRGVAVTITGRAYVTGETTCLFDEADPFRFGIQTVDNRTVAS